MTQPRLGKIFSTLRLNKAYTVLFLEGPYNPKRVLPIKVCVTLYKPNIFPVLCRGEIRLRCYIIDDYENEKLSNYSHLKM